MKHLGMPGVRDALVARVLHLAPDAPRQWGRMSAHGMVRHLVDSFQFAIGERPIAPKITWLTRTVIKYVALQTPIPWPKDVETRPEVDQMLGGSKPGDFAADRAELVAVIARFMDHRGARPPHPLFGEMTEIQWLRWGWLHTDHHLRQFRL